MGKVPIFFVVDITPGNKSKRTLGRVSCCPYYSKKVRVNLLIIHENLIFLLLR